MAEKMTGGKMGGGSKSSGGAVKSIATPDIMSPVTHDKPIMPSKPTEHSQQSGTKK